MSEPRALVTGTDRAATRTGTLAAIGFASLAVFEAALAAGAPWGHAACCRTIVLASARACTRLPLLELQ
jgi:hypothetical protein